MNRIQLTSTKMSTKLIKIPYTPIKPREDSGHHQVETWTLKWTMCIQTTYKLISTKL